jgi:hypothetical protein
MFQDLGHHLSRHLVPYALAAIFVSAAPALIPAALSEGMADDRVTAAAPVAPSPTTVNVQGGVAIKGYDPVAYFTDGRAVPGDPRIGASLNGVTWRFATAEHRKAFLAHPAKYQPEYGGFCAYGMAAGHKADIDPEAFTIVGGRLYLNYSKDVMAAWRKDIPSLIAKADHNWPAVSAQQDVQH